MLTLIVTLLAVFLGAVLARISGMGFALVAAPLLVAIHGPYTGVAVGNALSIVTAAFITVRLWRHIEWRRAVPLVVGAAITVPFGAWIAERTPAPPLLIGMSVLVLLALAVVVRVQRVWFLTLRGGAVIAGGFSGFMNAASGLGGPALAVYGASNRIAQDAFVGTTQFVIVIVNTLSLLWKGTPHIGAIEWIVAGIALAAGMVVGECAARWVSARVGRWLLLTLATAGAVTTLGRGICTL